MKFLIILATAFLSITIKAGTAHSAELYASPSMVSFYGVRVGSSRYTTIRLTNRSFDSMYVEVDGFDCYNKFRVSDFNCDKLDPTQSCEIQVEFSPRREGRYRCNVIVESTHGDRIRIPVSGDAVEY